jgi:predicted regulator of Ras-like GTPase activity (Roadblock/LC7/MglB family)
MSWKTLTQIAVASGLILAQTLTHSAPSSTKAVNRVEAEEVLSYECAKSVATIVSTSEQTGPLFSEGRLIFTSVEAQDQSILLLVNAGYGNFAINLESKDSVNRIRFEVPTEANKAPHTFFLSYLHGGTLRSRYFEYSEDQAPTGHDELDYSLVSARRADYMMAHLDYAIHETAEATLQAITEGKITRSQMMRHKVGDCEHIARMSPSIAKNLRHNLDMLDLIVMGPQVSTGTTASTMATVAAGRTPASL